MNDTFLADYLPLKSLCNQLPSRRHVATAHRWATRGVRGIRLRTYLVGGTRMTTLADFEQFVREVSAARELTTSSVERSSPNRLKTASRRSAASRAERELDRRNV